MNAPLRRTRADLLATGAITLASLAIAGTAFFSAPIRSNELVPAAQEYSSAARLAAPPTELKESFRLPDTSPGIAPVVADGLIITHDGTTLTATSPTGERVWSYKRELKLCALDKAWDKVVATYRGPAGCGDVVAIDASTGTYAGTRSAPSPDSVRGISSADRVGYVSPERVELWRSDLVRTVEYGRVEAPQESGMQPHACTIASALTRKELLAVAERCEDGTWLRLQTTTPEDSRKPEVRADVELPDAAYLVAIAPEAVAVYDPAAGEITVYDATGDRMSVTAAPDFSDTPDAPGSETSDLPHHMSYFSAGTLALFEPDSLRLSATFTNALGTGTAAGDRMLVPTAEGIAVADWDTARIERVIDVQRNGYTGPTGLATAGDSVVEKRGAEVVVYAAR